MRTRQCTPRSACAARSIASTGTPVTASTASWPIMRRTAAPRTVAGKDILSRYSVDQHDYHYVDDILGILYDASKAYTPTKQCNQHETTTVQRYRKWCTRASTQGVTRSWCGALTLRLCAPIMVDLSQGGAGRLGGPCQRLTIIRRHISRVSSGQVRVGSVCPRGKLTTPHVSICLFLDLSPKATLNVGFHAGIAFQHN